MGYRKIIAAALTVLSLTSFVVNINTFAITNQNNANETSNSSVREITKNFTRRFLLKGAAVVGGAAATAGLVYTGYKKCATGIKYPVMINIGFEDKLSEKNFRKSLSDYVESKKEFILIEKSKKNNNNYIIVIYLIEDGSLVPSWIIKNEDEFNDIINLHFKNKIKKSGLYSGNALIFKQIAALPRKYFEIVK